MKKYLLCLIGLFLITTVIAYSLSIRSTKGIIEDINGDASLIPIMIKFSSWENNGYGYGSLQVIAKDGDKRVVLIVKFDKAGAGMATYYKKGEGKPMRYSTTVSYTYDYVTGLTTIEGIGEINFKITDMKTNMISSKGKLPEYESEPEESEPVCGNEIIEDSEECDDGNLINGDDCSDNCMTESVIEVHDVGLVEFDNSFGKIRLEYLNNTDILENPARLTCNEKYKISVRVENFGDFTENITFNGEINGLIFTPNPKNDLESKDYILKYKTVNFDLEAGSYDIKVEAIIPFDDVPGNNFASRKIEVVCE